MSNFFLVVADDARASHVRGWMSRIPVAASELHEESLGTGHTLFLVARDIATSVRPGVFFRGTAVSPESSSVVFGVDGWRETPEGLKSDPAGLEGEYLLARWTNSLLHVARDVFSSVALMHTSGRGVVAVSDSLLMLADLRRNLNLPVTPDPDVLVGRAVLGGFATQQMSPDTQVREIGFVTTGFEVVVDTRDMKVRFRGMTVADRLFSRNRPYSETIRESGAFVVGLMGRLATTPGWLTGLSLSGGYDSRIVLAGAERAGVLERMEIESRNVTAAHAPDYQVALELSAKYGFALNEIRAEERGPALRFKASPVAIWASSLLGVYDRMVPGSSVRWGSRRFGLTGIGAEVLKGNWEWRTFAEVFRDLDAPPARRGSLIRLMRSGLRSNGGRERWQDASEIYYLGYRNGLHGASHSAMHLTGLRPLQQFRLAALAHSRRDGHRRRGRDRAPLSGSYEAVTDLLIATHPEMAELPYDRPSKALSASYIAERLRAIGGPIDAAEVPSINVYGDPSSVPAGPSGAGTDIAREYGFGIPMKGEEVIRLGHSALPALPEPARTIYKELFTTARRKLIYDAVAPSHAGAAPAKLLTAVIFAR